MKKRFYIKGNILRSPRAKVIKDGFLKVEDGVVRGIHEEKGNIEDKDCEVFDFEGNYLIPGLINTHCHLMFPGDNRDTSEVMASYSDSFFLLTAAENARKALKSGVTTLRVLGGTPEIVFKFREAVNKGLYSGPRILTSGPALLPTGGHGWQSGIEVDTDGEIKKAVRSLVKNGADIIKVMAGKNNQERGNIVTRRGLYHGF